MADPATWWEKRLADERENRRPEWCDFDRAEPNPAHHALARLEALEILRHLITQNVDGLHTRAGSRAVTEIHDNRYRLRCTACGARRPRPERFDTLPPRCDGCGGVLKFDTIMFGEPIPTDALAAADQAAQTADVMLVVGTSAVARPAADLPVITHNLGGMITELNPEESALSRLTRLAVRAPAGAALPRLVAGVERLQGSGALARD